MPSIKLVSIILKNTPQQNEAHKFRFVLSKPANAASPLPHLSHEGRVWSGQNMMKCPNCHPIHAIREFLSTSNTLLIRIAFSQLHRIQLGLSRNSPLSPLSCPLPPHPFSSPHAYTVNTPCAWLTIIHKIIVSCDMLSLPTYKFMTSFRNNANEPRVQEFIELGHTLNGMMTRPNNEEKTW